MRNTIDATNDNISDKQITEANDGSVEDIVNFILGGVKITGIEKNRRVGGMAENDNTPVDSSELILKAFCSGKNILTFTSNLFNGGIISQIQKDFLDEILGRFGEFDLENKDIYSLLELKKLTIEVLIIFEKNRNELKAALSEFIPSISMISEEDIYIVLRDLLQGDVSLYGLETGVSEENITKVSGEISQLTRDMIYAMSGKRA